MKPERQVIGLFLFGLVLTGVAFTAGRYSAPDRVEYRDREVVRTVVQEDTQARERVAELTAQLETMSRHTRREVTTEKRPDGTEVTHSVTDTRVDTVKETSARTDRVAEVETQKHAETERTRETQKLELRDRPDWRVGLLAGATVDLRPSIGVHVERRILGPLSLGAWLLPQAQAAGLSLSIEF